MDYSLCSIHHTINLNDIHMNQAPFKIFNYELLIMINAAAPINQLLIFPIAIFTVFWRISHNMSRNCITSGLVLMKSIT